MTGHTISSIEGKLILVATILASGMAFLDGTIVTLASPAILSSFHSTFSGIEWVVNGYALMLCALILISGSLGDRFGRKRIFLYGIVVFIVSSFLCAISGSIVQLAIFRAIQGIGGAMMVPGSLSIINVSFKESVRGQAIGYWAGFSGAVPALGLVLGGLLVQSFGWPSIFYINIPLGIIALFITLRFVPETKNHESTRVDFIGAVLIFLSLLGIAYGLISGPEKGWNDLFIFGSIIAGVVLFIFFLFSQTRVKEPLIPLQIFKSPLVTGANIATLFLYFALSGVLFFLTYNMITVQHYSFTMTSLATVPTILLITFLSGPAGSLADKIGPRLPMIVGPLIVSLGMALLALPGRNVNYFLYYLPGLVLFGLGMALVIAPLTKSALAVDEGKFSGAASGVNNAVARVAGLLAVALLGAIILSLFETQLHSRIGLSSMNENQKQQIMVQQNKLVSIDIPAGFNKQFKKVAQDAIEDSFIYGFRWAMGINAALAFLSAVVSFIFIRPAQKKA